MEAKRIADALALVAALHDGRSDLDIDAAFADLLDPSRPPGGFDPKSTGGCLRWRKRGLRDDC